MSGRHRQSLLAGAEIATEDFLVRGCLGSGWFDWQELSLGCKTQSRKEAEGIYLLINLKVKPS